MGDEPKHDESRRADSAGRKDGRERPESGQRVNRNDRIGKNDRISQNGRVGQNDRTSQNGRAGKNDSTSQNDRAIRNDHADRYDRIAPPQARQNRDRFPPSDERKDDDDAEESYENTLIGGRNPIREALKSERSIDRLLVAEGDLTGTAMQIVAMARERGVVVQYVDRRKLDAMMPAHQGLIAQVPAHDYVSVEAILAKAKEAGEDPLVVVLDGITDPHNLGAILRSAEAFGAHGVVTGKRRSAGLTPIAVKASAGAASHIGMARVTNIAQTVAALQQAGLWAIAADLRGGDIRASRLDGPLCLVVGDEGEGVSRLVRERCDATVSIPLSGRVSSLNASVAAGILLYHAAGMRRPAQTGLESP